MKKIKIYTQLLLVALLTPVLSACDQEDDVVDIFTGKTWYMTYIAVEGQNKMYDFWQGNEEARIQSFKTIVGDNYTLTFDGADLGNSIGGGTFSGKVTSINVSGSWNANGENRTLVLETKNTGTDADKYLGKEFVEGLKNAVRYGGDNKNLYIYYNEGATTKFISFAPQRNNQ